MAQYSGPVQNDSDQKGNTFPDFQSRYMTITIIDSRQSRLQNIVSYILSSLKPEVTNDKTTVEKRNSNDYIHMGYEAVTISADSSYAWPGYWRERFMHMSGRRGIYINADYILDRLHEKA